MLNYARSDMAKNVRQSKVVCATTYVALLRGINVGGKNSIPMRELAAMFAKADCADVRTYIQSGNVIFTASPKCAKMLPKLMAEQIEHRFGFHVPVIIRSADELQRVATKNPFLRRDIEPDQCHVAFLANTPNKADAAELDPRRSPGDSFMIQGQEIYLHLPKGVAKSKLTNAYFDSKLRTVSTVRNWRTVLKLIELSKLG
ncbi:MAG: DUF1697 domain-containing protein [Planctomycetes bacterium]|nr:DUF1697 domain-containing protein [Planctomycetota bacterium]MBI3833538.1 DUF1697 domain-containing protein [Planctomycetota bacterium]